MALLLETKNEELDAPDEEPEFDPEIEEETTGPAHRGGRLRAGKRSRDEVYQAAKALGIAGRSKMKKDELELAVDRRRGRR